MTENMFVLKLTRQQADNLANLLDLACKAGGLQVLDAVHDLTQMLRASTTESATKTKGKKTTTSSAEE